MSIAYFDCFAGASGDMIVGALLDAGTPFEQFSAELAKLRLPPYALSADRIVKQGFAATKFNVRSVETGGPIDYTEDDGHADEHGHTREHRHGHAHEHEHSQRPGTAVPGTAGEAHPEQTVEHDHGSRHHAHTHHGVHRHLADIREIIESAGIPARAKKNAIEVFTRLAEAEGRAHGQDIDAVHFHEVGAIDAIVDVVGACVATDLLGIERVIVSPLPAGSGMIRCAHGMVPAPAPATAELLKGVPIGASRNPGELTTPTGAAILTTLADEFAEAIPAGLKITAVGVGAGTRDGANVPNLLRVMIADSPGPGTGRLADETADTVVLMETNLDDIDGVAIGHCFGLLLDAGALDVWATPVVMKKNRPAYMLSVLVEPDSPAEDACRNILFSQTSTFGIRQAKLMRTKLARQQISVETPYGPIRVKVGRLGEAIVQCQPEYEDCREAANRTGESLTEVRRAALAAFRQTNTGARD